MPDPQFSFKSQQQPMSMSHGYKLPIGNPTKLIFNPNHPLSPILITPYLSHKAPKVSLNGKLSLPSFTKLQHTQDEV